MTDRKLAASKAIRELIKVQTGKTRIFNNIYNSGTRTIKIYRKGMDDVDIMLLRDTVVDLANLFGLDVKFKTTAGAPWGGPAFIIKL